MRTTEMVLIALFLKTSKFIPAYIYIIFAKNTWRAVHIFVCIKSVLQFVGGILTNFVLLLRRVLFINLLETAVHYFVNKDMFVLPDMLFHTAPAFLVMSPKFKRVSLNFFLGSPHWVDFDLRDSKKMENINKL